MGAWHSDLLLEGFQSRSWVIPGAERAEHEPDVPITGTLVRRGEPRHDRAVLYLHGWTDYFFQSHLADWFDLHGFDFYAVELRRYGRNLQSGLYPGYTTDLYEYYAELDHSVTLIHEDHPGVPITMMGHSLGGLISALWADDRPGLLHGLILNTPWLDMMGPPALWRALSPMVRAAGSIKAMAALPAEIDTGFYRRSLHISEDGEWDWDLDLKGSSQFVVRLGWGRAVLAAQRRVSRGLHIDTPIIALSSTTSDYSRTWNDAMVGEDVVLDVRTIIPAALNLGDLVTIQRIAGGVHDLALSREPVRAVFFDEIERWLDAYVRPPGVIEGYRQRLRGE